MEARSPNVADFKWILKNGKSTGFGITVAEAKRARRVWGNKVGISSGQKHQLP